MMKFKIPKNTKEHYWTKHVIEKMKYYGLSEQRIRGVIRNPRRKEDGIVENTIAVMQPPSVKIVANKPIWKQEIWAMYQISRSGNSRSKSLEPKELLFLKMKGYKPQARNQGKIKIISAWRYPGVSPKKDPIPEEILQEIKNLP